MREDIVAEDVIVNESRVFFPIIVDGEVLIC